MRSATKNMDDFSQGLAQAVGGAQLWGRNLDQTLNFIATGTGSRHGCMSSLEQYACISGLLSWFKDGGLATSKHWFYVSAKLRRILYQERPAHAAMPTCALLSPLVSDHEPLIRWCAHNDRAFSGPANFNSVVDPAMANNPRREQYHWLSAMLAARGDWRALEERSLRFLRLKPSRVACTVHDHEFLLALSRGDRGGMQTALSEMVKPEIYKRYDELGVAAPYAYRLIDTFGVIFTKIAWRNGYQIVSDSPYIPMEWMPVVPLERYEDPYEFMKDFDINQPLPPVPTIIPT